MLPRSAYRGIEREDRGPEQVGLGYRAVSAVGGLQRTCSYGSKKGMINSLLGTFTPLYSKYAFLGALRSAAQMVSYEVSIGLILIVRLVSAFGSAKAINRSDVPLTQPGNGPEGTAAWGMSASRRKAHF
jgi:hypothetical protein